MNTLRPLTTSLFAILTLLLVAPLAQAQSDAVGERWIEGAPVDDVYSDVPPPARDLRVQVWHENESEDRPYRRGENFELYFESNADAYVVIYRIQVDGQVEILWPTSRYDDGFVYGNHTFALPRAGSPVRLTAGRTKGVEYVQAIASELPFDLRRLSVDFRFDVSNPTDYAYAIAGDPFLAVNDINFAITGLEDDVDYVVTDWAHLYVESKVDYARYTCTQCHAGDDGEVYTSTVRPYVDECTTVNVYADWGWQRRWYVSYGWYPLYYEPAYYYWDPYYGRPYWFSYYPVYYSWPRHHVYTRPYYWYAWHDSPWYGGDFRVRYDRGRGGGRLYDFDRVKTRTRDVPGLGAVASGSPTSIDRIQGPARAGRVSSDRLVRDTTPTLVRSELVPRTSARDTRTRAGIRQDRGVTQRSERRLTSLTPQREVRSNSVGRTRDGRGTVERRESTSRTERRWTRPVIRNEERSSRDRTSIQRDRTSIQRDRTTGTRRAPTVDRSRSTNRGRVERPSTPTRRSTVERDRSSSSNRTRERSVDRNRTRSNRDSGKVERSKPSRPTRQKVAPQRSAPRKESSNSGKSRSRSSGGGSKSRERGGGGGRG